MVVMLQAYFDESGTHENAPAVLVAGYLFEPERCLALESDWSIALNEAGVSAFHMKDWAASKGEFSSMGKCDRDDFYMKLLNLIKRDASKGIAAQVSQAEFDRIKPANWNDRIGGAYSVCATLCLQAIGLWCKQNWPDENIAYFFEAGHESANEASRFMDLIARSTVLTKEYRYYSHTFVKKKESTLLQTADILAWEINKENVEKTYAPRRRNPRKSLISLTSVPTTILMPKEKDLSRNGTSWSP